MIIEGIDVRGVVDNNNWIKLPKMRTWAQFTIDKKEIATPDEIKQWCYLNVIASEITQTDDVQVGLLIGANCMKASEPLMSDFKFRWWNLHLSDKARLVHCGSHYQYGFKKMYWSQSSCNERCNILKYFEPPIFHERENKRFQFGIDVSKNA